MSIRFKFLTGDMNWQTYGGSFVSKKLCNGYDGKGAVKGEDYDFHYWFVMSVNPDDSWWPGDKTPHYYVSLSVVAPEAVPDKELQDAYRCMGIEADELERLRADPLFVVECLHSYGTSACIWQGQGNNLGKLMKEARHEATVAEMMFGSYMDRQLNGLGSTGWDFVAGDPLGALARRYEDATED